MKASVKGLGKPFDPPRAAERRHIPEDDLARWLGWFSAGLGAVQLPAPGLVNRLVGVRDTTRSRLCQRFVGLQELGLAGGIFSQRRPAPFLWSRVAGDVMHLGLLGTALGKSESRPRTYAAIGSVAGIAALDAFAAVRTTRAAQAAGTDPTHVTAAVTVRAPRDDVYRFWHDFQNLPRFMAHVESVQVSDGRSHWKASAPAGRTVEWDAEVVEDRPGELLAGQSLPGARVPNSGVVSFRDAPGDRGTEIRLDMRYDPPGGTFGAAAAKLSGEEPKIQVNDDLRRFKQVMETGVVTASEGTPEGADSRRLRRQRPAQPLEAAARPATTGESR